MVILFDVVFGTETSHALIQLITFWAGHVEQISSEGKGADEVEEAEPDGVDIATEDVAISCALPLANPLAILNPVAVFTLVATDVGCINAERSPPFVTSLTGTVSPRPLMANG